MRKRIFIMLVAGFLLCTGNVYATFDSGSTGVDGAFSPTSNTVLQLPSDGVFNFTTVYIPSGVTVTFQKNASNTPVYILATGDVIINGTINVDGGSYGTRPIPGKGGTGGYDGGYGSPIGVPSGRGLGPGGGGGGKDNTYFRGGGGSYASQGGSPGTGHGSPGTTYGNIKLVPLIGGSGGGGALGDQNYGGGGGGGAILIASSTSITVSGTITANGGQSYCFNYAGGLYGLGGDGSGGAVRLIANIMRGSGTISARGGNSGCLNYGGAGRIRLEAYTNNFTSLTAPTYTFGLPGSVFITNAPSLQITSIGGVAVSASPTGSYSTPDVMLPSATTNPVAVVVSASQIPVGTEVKVTVIPQMANAVSTTGILSGSEQSSTASVNVNISVGIPDILMAEATYTQQQAMYYDGEKIEKVRVSSTMGGSSKTIYITEKGKEISEDELMVAGFVRR